MFWTLILSVVFAVFIFSFSMIPGKKTDETKKLSEMRTNVVCKPNG